MAAGFLSPIALIVQAFTDQGVVGAGYKVNVYLAGSTTFVTVYTSSALTTAGTITGTMISRLKALLP